MERRVGVVLGPVQIRGRVRQDVDARRVAVLRRDGRGRRRVPLRRVDVGAVGGQHLDDARVAVLRGHEDRGSAVARRGVQVRAVVGQDARDVGPPQVRRPVDGRVGVVRAAVQVLARGRQGFQNFEVALLDGDVERAPAVLGVGHVLQIDELGELRDDGRVVPQRREPRGRREAPLALEPVWKSTTGLGVLTKLENSLARPIRSRFG